MTKSIWCLAAMLAGVLPAAALAAPGDAIPLKQLGSFQTFHFSVGNPGAEVTLPPNGAKYLQVVEFREPARVALSDANVYMAYTSSSIVRFLLSPNQANTLASHSWEFTCRVHNVSKLAVRRMNSGPANAAAILTMEVPVVNDVATFTVPNYTASSNLIDVTAKPEYKTKD